MTPFTSLKTIFRITASSLRGERGHHQHWRLLDEEGLEQLLNEMSRKDQHNRFVHRIHPVTRYLVEHRLQEFQLQRWGNEQLHDARTSRENRYEDESTAGDEWVRPPSRIRSRQSRYLTLPDGRRARQLNASGTQAVPLCGIIAPVVVSDIPEKRKAGVWQKCSQCFGFHVEAPVHRKKMFVNTESVTGWVPKAEEESLIHCPKCQSSCLDVRTEGLFELHCLICGWLGELHPSRLTEEEAEQNAAVLAGASIRYVDDEEEEDHEDDLDGIVDWDAQEVSHEDVPTSEEQLLTRLGELWSYSAYRGVREGLLEATFLQPRSKEEVSLWWSVTLVFLENCRELSKADQRQFVLCLVGLSTEQLEEYLSEWWDPETETLAEILPDITPKLNRYRQACREKLERFRVRSAGIRILAPKFHPNPKVFEAAVA